MSDIDKDAVLKRYDPNKSRFDESTLRKKLVGAANQAEGRAVDKPGYKVDKASTQRIVDETAEHITDAKSVFEVLPDTKLAMDILVSCIMSPNDMISNELLFRMRDNTSDDELNGALLQVVKEYFTEELDLAKMCVPALEDMLFKTGSYPVIAVPRSGIDAIINGDSVSTEALAEEFTDDMTIKNIGYLSPLGGAGDKEGDKVTTSLESWASDLSQNRDPIKVGEFLTLVDNPTVLKQPLLQERIREERSRNLLDTMNFLHSQKVSVEDANGDKKEEQVVLYNKRKFKTTPFMELMDCKEVGNEEPIFFHPPSESIIPINVPGDVTRKVGYFVVLDGTGNPVSIASSKKHWDRLKSQSIDNGNSSEINRIREQLFGQDEHKDIKTVRELHKAYVTHLERKLHTSLRNGIHGDEVEVEFNVDAEMLMLSRALGRMKTQLLYIPKELMVYMAFDYNELGVGKSLLESTKIISSMRAMLLLANTQAGMRNSTPGTLLDIELDPLDKDPDSTIEKILALREQANMGSYPLGNMDLTNIANSINRSNIQVTVSNHPAYPQTKVKSEDVARSVSKVDTELEDGLRERHHQGWGVTPEMIDATRETDFAANVIMSNKLFAKRVCSYQSVFTDYLTDIARLFTRLSPKIQSTLIEKVQEDKIKVEGDIGEAINEFLDNFEVQLPSPDSSKVMTQMEELQQYISILDMAMEAYFSQDIMDMVVDSDLDDSILSTQSAIRAYFIRNWMRNNNVLPEIEALFVEDNGESILDQHTEFVTGILKMMSEKMLKTTKVGRKHERDAEKAITKEEEEIAKKEEEERRAEEQRLADEQGGDDDLTDETGGDDLTGGEDETAPTDDSTDLTGDGTDTTNTPEDDGVPPEDDGTGGFDFP